MAHDIVTEWLDLTLHRQGPVGRDATDRSGIGEPSAWRARITMTAAIALWLLTWLAGWWISRVLSSGSFVWTTAGASVGWLLGLGVAGLFLYLDERL